MGLSNLSFNPTVTWSLAKTNGAFGNTTQMGSKGFNFNGISLITYNQLYAATLSLGATGSQTVDLTSLTNLVGESVDFISALALIVIPSGSECTIQPGASNPLQWFFGGTTQSVVVPDGGFFAFSMKPTGTGEAVDSTHKNLKFTNSGATPLSLDVVIVGGT